MYVDRLFDVDCSNNVFSGLLDDDLATVAVWDMSSGEIARIKLTKFGVNQLINQLRRLHRRMGTVDMSHEDRHGEED